MKKITILLITCLSAIYSFSQGQEYMGTDASRIIPGAEKVWIKEGQSVPAFIQLSPSHRFPISHLSSWMHEALNLDQDYGFEYLRSESDHLGQQHHRYYLNWKGMPVFNGMFVVHSQNDKVYAINGDLHTSIKAVNSVVLSESEALTKALEYYSSVSYMWEQASEEALLKKLTANSDTSYYPKGRLSLIPDYQNKTESYHIAWAFNVYAYNPIRRGEIFVDAESGKILFENKLIRHADSVGTAVTKFSGTQPITTNYFGGTYRLRESSRGQGIETYNLLNGSAYGSAVDFTDTDNIWNNVNAQKDEIATDAHWGAEKTWDYYMYRHNRNSINGSGFKLLSYVHYNTNYANAFWDGQRMTYGDGNSSMQPLVALDIVAHEMSHGLTSFTADLAYQDESGAMNESFSDIFGTSVEFYAKPASANWTIGENIGSAMRSMSNPKAYGDPNCYLGTNYYIGTNDNGGVHTNSGVLNFWYYLLSQGGSGTNDKGNAYTVTGISIDSAARIAFRLLTVYLTSSSQFADARFYGIQAATDLYGPCSPQVAATTNAFYAIGVGPAYIQGVHADFSSPLLEFCSTPAQVSFKNLSSNAVNFTWHFGDGTTSTQLNPTHTYASPGSFAVKLVSDGLSCGIDSLQKLAYISIEPSNRCPYNMPTTGTQTLSSCMGRLFDSGGLNNYPDNKTVTTVITPTGASQITLSFLSFAFEAGFDYLHIYDGSSASSPKIGSYDGKSLPGTAGIITSTGGSITIVQQSDQGLSLEGFELLWDCSFPNAPPVAAFTVSDTNTCTGVISFTDRSTNGPNTWFWEFGDGNTSSLQHPTHTYLSQGYYTVKLTASNTIGQDTLVQTSLIHADIPETPAVMHSANCGPTSFTLQAPVQTGTTFWFDNDSSTTSIATGNTYSTGFITQSVSYYVENRISKPALNTGKPTNSGGGAYFTAAATHFLVFDAIKPFILKSVKVYAQSAGNRTISLQNSSGTTIDTRVINIPTGESRITLDFAVPAGTNFQLACSQSNGLYRNNAGCAYPYQISGLVNIKSSSATTAPTSYYYFYYDWEVQEDDCKSLRLPINAFIANTTPVASFSYTMNDPVVHFSDQTTNPGICTWDFGDGSSATGINPSHTYACNGVYSVRMKVYNGCGLDSSMQQLTIVATGIDQPFSHTDIKIFPNPTKSQISISGTLEGMQKTITLMDIRGRMLKEVKLENGTDYFSTTIDLSEFTSGLYLLKVSSNSQTRVFKLIKD